MTSDGAALHPPPAGVPARAGGARAWLALMRPHQWTKNLVLFAGLVFAREVAHPELLLRSFAAFALFCLLAASVYATNDVADAARDRLHPRKRFRPVASGAVRPGAAVAAAALWGGAAIAGAFLLAPRFGALAAGYLALHLAYSFALKHVAVLDVLLISVGFVMRAIAGVEVLRPMRPGIQISEWLLVCTLFLALFLGLCKRRAELTALQGQASDHRRVLAQYSQGYLDIMIGTISAALVMAYALYTIWPATVAKFRTTNLLYTVPIVVYGIFRYLYLVYHRELGGNPAEVLLKDRAIGLTVAAWMATVFAILY